MSRMQRLDDLLASGSGQVKYRIAGAIDGEGHSLLHLEVEGTLKLKCQRCLGEFDYPLRIRSNLKLVKDEADLVDIEDEDPDVDSIVVREKMEILPMIEDEILLELPYAPRHVECEGSGDGDDERESPFAVLKGRI
ncbi:MAG: DUF177 domain-containing protein [Burkholderiales bacterium]|nr:DUF177 domain-containing protein [Burkholderiales bacterium]